MFQYLNKDYEVVEVETEWPVHDLPAKSYKMAVNAHAHAEDWATDVDAGRLAMGADGQLHEVMPNGRLHACSSVK